MIYLLVARTSLIGESVLLSFLARCFSTHNVNVRDKLSRPDRSYTYAARLCRNVIGAMRDERDLPPPLSSLPFPPNLHRRNPYQRAHKLSVYFSSRKYADLHEEPVRVRVDALAARADPTKCFDRRSLPGTPRVRSVKRL